MPIAAQARSVHYRAAKQENAGVTCLLNLRMNMLNTPLWNVALTLENSDTEALTKLTGAWCKRKRNALLICGLAAAED